jgi:hypothetical protein
LIDKARSRARGTGDNLSIAVVKLEPLLEPSAATVRKIEIPSISSIKAGKG